jgi:cell division GTPase FtsZ
MAKGVPTMINDQSGRAIAEDTENRVDKTVDKTDVTCVTGGLGS